LAKNIGVVFVVMLVIESIDFYIMHWVIEMYHSYKILSDEKRGRIVGMREGGVKSSNMHLY
jgi:hypothetical protein